jgi:hypothetical protein
MAYTVRIPRTWYDELNGQCEYRGFSKAFVAGLIMQESSWNPDAKGDYVGGNPTSFGLGQISVGAAKDAGWTGSDTAYLLLPTLNIRLCVTYLQLCKTWAKMFDSRGDVTRYGINACTLSVYNQGPGGFQNSGIARNLDSYVKPVQSWEAEIAAGGVVPDDTGETPTPPPSDPKTPPPVPDQTPADLSQLMSKYAEAVRLELVKERAARPWPPAADYHTEVGQALYFLATAMRDVVNVVREWLGRLPA